MSMYKPPHPGEFIKETYLEPFGYSYHFLAKQLDGAFSTLNRILKG
jgi:plasmid maintenance system antidote protein VapI